MSEEIRFGSYVDRPLRRDESTLENLQVRV